MISLQVIYGLRFMNFFNFFRCLQFNHNPFINKKINPSRADQFVILKY